MQRPNNAIVEHIMKWRDNDLPEGGGRLFTRTANTTQPCACLEDDAVVVSVGFCFLTINFMFFNIPFRL